MHRVINPAKALRDEAMIARVSERFASTNVVYGVIEGVFLLPVVNHLLRPIMRPRVSAWFLVMRRRARRASGGDDQLIERASSLS